MSKFRQFEDDDNYYDDDFDANNGFDAYKKPVTRLDNNNNSDELWGEPKKKSLITRVRLILLSFVASRLRCFTHAACD